MTDAEYKKQKKRVRDLVRKWIEPLGLRWWTVTVEYERERKRGSEADYRPGGAEWECAMDTSCDPWYKMARIVAYLPIIAELSDEEVESSFLHELMHILVSPIHSKKTAKEEELVVTNLAQAFKHIWYLRK